MQDLPNEERWILFAPASAAAGIASTLSLPVLDGERVVGGINLYASTGQAFFGRHQQVADALDASDLGAVTHSDLGFQSRHRAAEAPERLRGQRLVEVALCILRSPTSSTGRSKTR